MSGGGRCNIRLHLLFCQESDKPCTYIQNLLFIIAKFFALVRHYSGFTENNNNNNNICTYRSAYFSLPSHRIGS